MTTWNLQGLKRHILICNGSTCMKVGAEEVTTAIREEIERLQLDEQIHTTRTRCNGRCKDKCVVISYPDATWYNVPDEAVAKQVVHNTVDSKHIVYSLGQAGLVHNEASDSVKGISKTKHKHENK